MTRAVTALLLLALGLPSAAEDRPAHHTEAGFRNTLAGAHPGEGGSFLRARFGSGPWPGHDADNYTVPTASPQLVPTGTESANASVTWIGHATVLLQHRGVNVITDPMLSRYASPVSWAGPSRISEPALTLAELPPIDAVVISHNHYDHLDKPTIDGLGNGPRYFVPLGLKSWLEGRGIDPERVEEMDWWDERELHVRGQTVRITATPSQHFSGRSLTDENETLWAAWAIAWQDWRAWFGGDTGYNAVQFKEIGERFGGFDLGILPIGAYRPRWFMKIVHVNPAEAVEIHRDIGARRSMGVHWGTFVLSQEASSQPPIDLSEATEAAGLPEDAFTTYRVGETRRYLPHGAQAAAH